MLYTGRTRGSMLILPQSRVNSCQDLIQDSTSSGRKTDRPSQQRLGRSLHSRRGPPTPMLTGYSCALGFYTRRVCARVTFPSLPLTHAAVVVRGEPCVAHRRSQRTCREM